MKTIAKLTRETKCSNSLIFHLKNIFQSIKDPESRKKGLLYGSSFTNYSTTYYLASFLAYLMYNLTILNSFKILPDIYRISSLNVMQLLGYLFLTANSSTKIKVMN